MDIRRKKALHHQELAHPAVSVQVRMNIYENKVAQHGFYLCLRFVSHEFKKQRHGIC